MILIAAARGIPRDIQKTTHPLDNKLQEQSIIGLIIGCVVAVITVIIYCNHKNDQTIMGGLCFMGLVTGCIAAYYTFVPPNGVSLHNAVAQNTNDFLDRKKIAGVPPVYWDSFIKFLKSVIDSCFGEFKFIIANTSIITFVIVVSLSRLIIKIKDKRCDLEEDKIKLALFFVGVIFFAMAIALLFICNERFCINQEIRNRVDLLNNGYMQNSQLAVQSGALGLLTDAIMVELRRCIKKMADAFDWHTLWVGILGFMGGMLMFIGMYNRADCLKIFNNEIAWLPSIGHIGTLLGVLQVLFGGFISLKKFMTASQAIRSRVMTFNNQVGDKAPAGNLTLNLGNKEQVIMRANITNPFTGSIFKSDFQGKAGISFVMGANGAGKSTTMQLLSGEHGYKPGQVELKLENGNLIPAEKLRSREMTKILKCQSQTSKPNHLTIGHILSANGVESRTEQKILVREINHMLGWVFKDQRMSLSIDKVFGVDHMSGGERQVLLNLITIFVAINKRVRFLILDEITQNLSPEVTRKFISLLTKIAVENNIHIIIISHDNVRIFKRKKLFPKGLPVRVIKLIRGKLSQLSKIQ